VDGTVLIDLRWRGNRILDCGLPLPRFSEDGTFLAYSVRQGGSGITRYRRFSTSQGGLCFRIVFQKASAPDCFRGLMRSGFLFSHREMSDPRPNYRAVYLPSLRYRTLTRSGNISSLAHEANLRLGFFTRRIQTAGYVVFSNRQVPPYLDLPTNVASKTPPKAKLLLRTSRAAFCTILLHTRLLALHGMLPLANFRIVSVDVTDPTRKLARHRPESDRRIQGFAVGNDQDFRHSHDRPFPRESIL